MKIPEFTKFGITFKPLSEANLEMVRIWRNSDDVRVYMQYQEIISKENQLKWFQELDKSKNFYFVAYENGFPFGLYNVKDVDFEKKTCEPGVFLKSKEFWEGGLAMRGSLAIGDFIFKKLNLEALIIHVLKNNEKVLAYNKKMGYQILNEDSESISYELTLKRDEFYENKITSKILKYLEKYYN